MNNTRRLNSLAILIFMRRLLNNDVSFVSVITILRLQDGTEAALHTPTPSISIFLPGSDCSPEARHKVLDHY